MAERSEQIPLPVRAEYQHRLNHGDIWAVVGPESVEPFSAGEWICDTRGRARAEQIAAALNATQPAVEPAEEPDRILAADFAHADKMAAIKARHGRRVVPQPPPRYDAVYAEGVVAMERAEPADADDQHAIFQPDGTGKLIRDRSTPEKAAWWDAVEAAAASAPTLNVPNYLSLGMDRPAPAPPPAAPAWEWTATQEKCLVEMEQWGATICEEGDVSAVCADLRAARDEIARLQAELAKERIELRKSDARMNPEYKERDDGR